MIKIRVQLEELVGDMFSYVREVDIALDDIALKQIANALGWHVRGVLEQVGSDANCSAASPAEER